MLWLPCLKRPEKTAPRRGGRVHDVIDLTPPPISTWSYPCALTAALPLALVAAPRNMATPAAIPRDLVGGCVR